MIVVADTSVLLNLCRVGQVELLRQLFGDIVIPPEVAAEFARLSAQSPHFLTLILPGWVRQQAAGVVPPLVRSALGLNPGETAALALAVEIHADAILVDERRGRQVALQLGLRTTSHRPRGHCLAPGQPAIHIDGGGRNHLPAGQ